MNADCYHWSREYRDSSPLSNKEKGDLGESRVIRTLRILKEELDLLASVPVKLAHLKETDDIPDIYVEGWNRGFLIESKNWWTLYRYGLRHVNDNILSKDFSRMEYPVRLTGDANGAERIH